MKTNDQLTGLLTVVGVVALLLILGACQSNTNRTAATSNRPNVLFIMSDDHTSQAVSAYGGPLATVCPTPHIDRIAKGGMLFRNCFVTNSICTPSRSAIFTGQYAHRNGVYKFTALDQTQPTLPKVLQDAGYHTALIGKYHLHSNPIGLDFYSLLPGQGRYHNPQFIEVGDIHSSGWLAQGKRTEYSGHSSDVIADKVVDYLQQRNALDQTFMLFCHFKAPHDTWEYAERYESFLADTEIPEPPNLLDDYEGRSDALRTQLQYIGSEWGNHTNFEEETAHLTGVAKKRMQYQLYMKKYLRCVKGVDDNVGRILDFLDESGLSENTIVIYTGDQGFYLGEHGMYDKRFMYEEGLRMPFLVRWPGQVQSGSESDGMILNVDFAPTILAAVGAPALPEAQGKSFLPLLNGRIPRDWRTSMYYRYYYSHFKTEPHIGVRTYRHKLIHYNRIDQWELYDLEKDRSEMKNLYGAPAYAAITKELQSELVRLQKELGDDPADDGSRPNIGNLAPQPLFKSQDISLADTDNSLLFRLRTEEGGTLFSRCSIDEVPYSEGFTRDGFKTLCLRQNKLYFFDGFDGDLAHEIDVDLSDGQWHTVALIVEEKIPKIYVDNLLVFTGTEALKADHPSHTFNVGAGIDTGGYRGYNFRGDISHVYYRRGIVEQQDLKDFKTRKINDGKYLIAASSF